MVEKVIEYLVNLPTTTTSPIWLAVNTPAMLAEMGNGTEGPAQVAVYIGDAAQYEAPYVRVWAGLDNAPGQVFLGRSWNSQESILCECVSDAETYLKANRRSDYLGRAVEAAIEAALRGHTITNQADLGGTTSYDQLSMFQIVPPGQNPDTQSTGKTASTPSRSDVRLVRVNLTVHHQR